jgi:hypothetical protein
MAYLVMQPAKNISRGERLIVLHEPLPDSEIGHNLFVIALEKKTAGISEYFRFEKQESGKWGWRRFHGCELIELRDPLPVCTFTTAIASPARARTPRLHFSKHFFVQQLQ